MREKLKISMYINNDVHWKPMSLFYARALLDSKKIPWRN